MPLLSGGLPPRCSRFKTRRIAEGLSRNQKDSLKQTTIRIAKTHTVLHLWLGQFVYKSTSDYGQNKIDAPQNPTYIEVY